MKPELNTAETQLGRILVEWGLVTDANLNECLEIQRGLEKEGAGYIPRLGELLVERGHATADMVLEALSAQNRRILYCPKCQSNSNVDVRPDIVAYKCGTCQTELIAPPQADQIQAGDSTIMVVTKDPLPTDVQMRIQDGQSKFGKYVLMQEIGHGGVGIVYKAWDTYLGQFVALKRLKPIQNKSASGSTAPDHNVQSLLKEARSAVRLRHPHIATVFDIGRINQEFYISMEYLEGRTLASDIQNARQGGKVSPFFEAPKRYVRYVRDVARALHYAHTRPSPVIHCDIKPSNIFITSEDRAYVLDFGLARNLHLTDEPAGMISGTPAYMAPEQASGRNADIDARTDVYGIGAILYELLSGRPPFTGSIHSVMRKAIEELPDRPTEVLTLRGGDTTRRLARMPAGLEEMILRCLEKDRESRFATAHEVANALDRMLKGESSTGTSHLAPGIVTPQPVRVGHIQTQTPDATPVAVPTPVRPSPAPAAAPPPPAEAPTPRRVTRFMQFGAGVGAATVLFAAAYLISTLRAPPDRAQVSIAQIMYFAAAFRPDLALQKCAAALESSRTPQEWDRLRSLKDRLEHMEVARRRVVPAIDQARPLFVVRKLRLRDKTLDDAEILKCTDDGLILYSQDRRTQVAWTEVLPEQILELAERALPSREPRESLGLGLFAMEAGQRERGRAMLQSVRGTAYGAHADAYLGEDE